MLYAPGIRSLEEIRAVCDAVSKPVNVYSMGLRASQVFEAGAQRISTAGGITWAAADAVIEAAERMRDDGDLSGLGTPKRISELGAF